MRLAAMADGDSTLILLRHGESQWNALNLFTGWVDVDLTDKGRAEAARAGELIGELDRLPDVVYTSLLRRAITTANLALDKADRHWIPVHRNWRLNERHYGALQGSLDKAETKAKYGEEQFMAGGAATTLRRRRSNGAASSARRRSALRRHRRWSPTECPPTGGAVRPVFRGHDRSGPDGRW